MPAFPHFMNSNLQSLESSQAISVAIVGGGPAGLMAAEVLSNLGHEVHVFDAMPSVGRKFLLAGRGGLNLTHSEPTSKLMSRFGDKQAFINPILKEWGATELRQWAHGLGIETFVGTSGRVFPTEMKAAPLLRAWLQRLRHPLQGKPVKFHMRHKLMGIAAVVGATPRQAELDFEVHEVGTPKVKALKVRVHAVSLAWGGASWSRLGSDGAWVPWLAHQGVPISPLQPANCGFHVAGRAGQGWTPFLTDRFAGYPLKSVTLSWRTALGEIRSQAGEFVASAYGLEGSLIYAASADLREQINAQGFAEIEMDLLPQLSPEKVLAEVSHPKGSRSLSSHLKSRLGLEGVKMALLNELLPPSNLQSPTLLAQSIKALKIKLLSTRPIDEAISTAGGVAWQGMTPSLELKDLPGVFCAGEMVDWEAPTGGYLLTASMSTGVKAAQGVHQKMKGDEP